MHPDYLKKGHIVGKYKLTRDIYFFEIVDENMFEAINPYTTPKLYNGEIAPKEIREWMIKFTTKTREKMQ